MDHTRSTDDSPSQRLIIDYIGTVRRIANRLASTLPRSVNVDDLIGAGLVGMADALAKFKDRNWNLDSFGAYAAQRIRGAMIDELRNADPLTRPLRLFVRRKEATIRKLEGELGRSPEEAEIAEEMGLAIAGFREQAVLTLFRGLSNLDTVLETAPDGAQFPDHRAETADTHVLRGEQRDRLTAALQDLPERLQMVVRLHYERDYSLREIGDELGVSESRACQLHREAIERLREAWWRAGGEVPDADAERHLPPASGWV